MTRRIIITPKASFDLDEQFAYIAQDNLNAAMRFFDLARQTFSQLERTPGIGRTYEAMNPRLAGLRKWPVKQFERHLIFYLTRDDAIEVVRILHASRDISRILKVEE